MALAILRLAERMKIGAVTVGLGRVDDYAFVSMVSELIHLIQPSPKHLLPFPTARMYLGLAHPLRWIRTGLLRVLSPQMRQLQETRLWSPVDHPSSSSHQAFCPCLSVSLIARTKLPLS